MRQCLICLPDRTSLFRNHSVVVAENSDEGSETLQKAKVPIMSTSVCNDLYSTLVEPKVIVGAEQVCAGYVGYVK